MNAPIPTSSHCEFDESNRLVYLTIDSQEPLSGRDSWLVAVDGSDHSLRATQEAIRLVTAMPSCALHLVNVQPWISKEAAEAKLAQLAWESTQASRNLIDAAHVAWRLHVVMGEPVDGIAALAKRLQCHAIVMGSHGLNAFKGLLLGSVAQGVIQRAVAPVMVVT